MSKKTDLEKKWISDIQKFLVGRTIVSVEYFAEEDCDEMGWSHRPVVIKLDNGGELFPMADDEGNDGGSIATNYKKLPIIPTL